MSVEVIPSVDEAVRRAIESALTSIPSEIRSAGERYGDPWRLAGLQDGVGRSDADGEGYAPSPRSTRGATRA